MTAAHPISRAWLSTGGTGAQNYDEFADESKITTIIDDNPTSILAVEMPHRTPEAIRAELDFATSLPMAAERLAALQEAGRFASIDDVVVAYRISGPGNHQAFGLFCMIDTDEISTAVDEPGRVIRNEDVFIEKVRERAALTETLDHLLSPVLLVQNGNTDELHEALAAACVGEPVVADTDEVGRVHEIWPVTGDSQATLLKLAGGGELIVADGNHRSLAAQVGELPRFLAVVTTPSSLSIDPYHRIVSDIPISGQQFLTELAGQRAIASISDEFVTPAPGVVALYMDGVSYEVVLPEVPGDIVEGMDHARVESIVFGEVLGMSAGDKRITYVGGDYPPSWLAEQVDLGNADLAILIAPVSIVDFISVNLQRLKLPRKSTWFTPKARAGLVLADLR